MTVYNFNYFSFFTLQTVAAFQEKLVGNGFPFSFLEEISKQIGMTNLPENTFFLFKFFLNFFGRNQFFKFKYYIL